MKDFKNDSDTTLARFGRDKRARISSAERIERRPRLQRDAADSEHSSDSRPRASYNPNFTSDNRPVREDRAHRDDSRRFGNRSFGSDDDVGTMLQIGSSSLVFGAERRVRFPPVRG